MMVWRTLLQEIPSYRDVFLTITEGYLLNNLLPFRLGEVGRAFLLSRKAGIGFWQVISSIMIERILDIMMAVSLLLSTLPFVVGATWGMDAAIGTGGIVLLFLLVLYGLVRYRPWAVARFEHLAVRWPVLLRFGERRLTSFFDGLASLADLRRFLTVMIWMILNWVVAIGQYYLLLSAFSPHPHLLWVVFTVGVVSLGIAAPSSPGALGVLELSVVAALSVFGLDASAALAFAATFHILGYLINGILGSYALARDGETLGKLYDKIKNLNHETQNI